MGNRILTLIIGIIATLRLTYMLMREEGPYDVFEKLRHISGVKYGERGDAYSNHPLGRVFICYYCLSIWCGAFIAIIQRKDPITHALFYSACTIILWETRKNV